MSGKQVDLTIRLGSLELANPIVTASGTFGHGAELARLCDPSRLGAVTAKSQAPFEWAGNPAPRLHPSACGMVNAVGLQGHGIEHWVAHDLPALRALGANVIASIWGHTIDHYQPAAQVVASAAGDVVALEINLSCPNLDAGEEMFSHDADATGRVVASVSQVISVPLFAKLSPGVADLPAVAGCPAPPSSRSRCERCTTSRKLTPVCP